MTCSRCLRSPGRGIELWRATVYGCSGASKRVTTSVYSTTLPAYMTATWSQISATTPRSCVMRTIAVPCSWISPRSRSRIWAWIAADTPHLGRRQRQQVVAVKEDPSRDDAPGRVGDQPQDGEHGHALAAARLAHDAERLRTMDGQIHRINSAHHTALGEEMRAQILDREERWCGHPQRSSRGSRASRRPSPTKLKASTASTM